MAMNRDRRSEQEDTLDEHTVFVNRCAKTVKGGRRMSFSAVIVVGDKEGRVGVGFGKANEVSDAIRKGGEAARKDMRKITLRGKTIPHDVEGVCDACRRSAQRADQRLRRYTVRAGELLRLASRTVGRSRKIRRRDTRSPRVREDSLSRRKGASGL